MWRDLLIVGAGGFVGSMARYASSLFLRQWWPAPMPWATLVINVTGCFCIGLLWSALLNRESDPRTILLFLATGVLGGFTTFSAFGLETIELLQKGETATALTYVLVSVVLGIAAVTLGRVLL